MQPEDPELKKQVQIKKIAAVDDLLGIIEEKHSCWLKMKRIIVMVLKWKINTEKKKEMMSARSKKLLDFSNKKLNLLHVELLQEAGKYIVKMMQSEYLNKKLKLLNIKNEDQ